MTDREKVIKGLEICVNRVPGKYSCNECPYEIDGNNCEKNLTNDAIILLKNQEERIGVLERVIEHMPKPVKLLDVFGNGYARIVRCKNCKHGEKSPTFEKYPDVTWCNKYSTSHNDNWFCADGERR